MVGNLATLPICEYHPLVHSHRILDFLTHIHSQVICHHVWQPHVPVQAPAPPRCPSASCSRQNSHLLSVCCEGETCDSIDQDGDGKQDSCDHRLVLVGVLRCKWMGGSGCRPCNANNLSEHNTPLNATSTHRMLHSQVKNTKTPNNVGAHHFNLQPSWSIGSIAGWTLTCVDLSARPARPTKCNCHGFHVHVPTFNQSNLCAPCIWRPRASKPHIHDLLLC